MSETLVAAEHWIEQFEQTFKQIQHTRMQDLPFLHQNLSVKAFGFKPYQQGYLGVLLTPWFMNLIYVRDSAEPLQVGSKQMLSLPAGQYEFIVNYEVPLGFYLSCSLFSPVLEFENQEAAEYTARYALLAVLQTPITAPSDDSHQTTANHVASTTSPNATQPDTPLAERLQQPLSRRAWLQGKFLRS